MDQPKRIQRKRTKGWVKPDNCVNVARPSRWGNPYQIKPVRRDIVMKWMVFSPDSYVDTEFDTEADAASVAIDLFSELIDNELNANPNALDELRGKNLMCWCAEDAACHADVLLKRANE